MGLGAAGFGIPADHTGHDSTALGSPMAKRALTDTCNLLGQGLQELTAMLASLLGLFELAAFSSSSAKVVFVLRTAVIRGISRMFLLQPQAFIVVCQSDATFVPLEPLACSDHLSMLSATLSNGSVQPSAIA